MNAPTEHEAEIARLTQQIATLQASNEAMSDEKERLRKMLHKAVSYIHKMVRMVSPNDPLIKQMEAALAIIQNQSELGK